MLRENLLNLCAFVAVAKERSFSRAAARMGVSPSALSHTIRALETRLGVLLLVRTTRSVSTTEAGARLLAQVEPHLQEIEGELVATQESSERPSGRIRITAIDYVVDKILLPRLAPLAADYPDIQIDIAVDYSLSDIVGDRFDIGVRGGDQVAKDMVAVRISPDYRMAIVGSPAYFAARPAPHGPADLTGHQCIGLQLQTYGGIYAWELKKGKRIVNVRTAGQFTFNGVYQMLNAALCGAGLAFVPEDLAAPYIASGQLLQVLEDWSPTFPGWHIFYPSRRQASRAFTLLVEALRYRA